MTKEELKELRQKMGLTQDQMADRLGRKRAMYCLYEKNGITDKAVEKLAERIAQTFSQSMECPK